MGSSRSSPLATLVAPPSSAEQAASPFAELDEIVAHPAEYGTVAVLLEGSWIGPLSRHIQRRANQSSRPVIVSGASMIAESWRELARALGVFDTSDPAILAQRIARACAGGVVVVATRRQSSWGREVGEQLAQLATQRDVSMLLILLRPSSSAATPLPTVRPRSTLTAAPPGEDARQLTLELDAVSTADGRRWWEAVLSQDDFLLQPPLDRLDTLDAWWESVRSRPAVCEPIEKTLSRAARRLLALAVRAGQALTPEQAAAMSTAEARDELVERGVLVIDSQGRLSPRDAFAMDGAVSSEQEQELAAMLVDPALATEGMDAWAAMRAAELYAAAGEAARAEQLALPALEQVADATARDDLWRRWQAALEQLREQPGGEPAEHLERLMRSAERALALGDGDRADILARQAMALDNVHFDVLLLRGRTSSCRGDVTTASLALLRALARATGRAEGARAAAALAEVRYMAGDFAEAEKQGQVAVGGAEDDMGTRLAARNVLGKLLLARGAWQQAEEHFAQDAYDAAAEGEFEGELRARLNRGIAILSLGRREQAREMFEEVLAEGEQHHAHRAVAYALANLATIAIVELDFPHALALSERAIDVRRQIGERMGLVRPITNLAELRLRLGMVAEAEQALRFGLQACGNALPASRYAYFALVAARIHLARGNTGDAARELDVARSGAACSGDGGMVGECERLGVRIALEEGALAPAEAQLEAARRGTPGADEHHELALLTALCRRAAGDPFAAPAGHAVALASRADDPEMLREAYELQCRAARLDGDDRAARRYLAAATAQRDRVADTLPEALRSRFLARADLVALTELEADSSAEAEALAPPTARAGGGKAGAHQSLVGESAAMRGLRNAISRVAATDATVLVAGETGTGKELVAEAIHRASARGAGPLVKVNCAALVETLLLSELFGHEKGAFTGASSRRRGRFELADGGTLFLDEIGDISARTQVALLRVLQDGTFERVGGVSTQRSNVRVVCATNRDLRGMVERGEFREDLYYRLCGVVLEVPPLRERSGDVALLAEALLARAHANSGVPLKPLGSEAVRALCRHSWPGNVRELENALRVAALFAAGPEIQLDDFTENVEGLRQLASPPSTPPPTLVDAESSSIGLLEGSPSSVASSTDLVYAEVRSGYGLAAMKKRLEKECIARALVESGGNITRAAGLLGMKRPRLSQLVKQYQLGTVLEEIKS